MFESLETSFNTLGFTQQTIRVCSREADHYQVKKYSLFDEYISRNDASQMTAIVKKASTTFRQKVKASILEFLCGSRFECIRNWAIKTTSEFALKKIDELFPKNIQKTPKDKIEYSREDDKQGNIHLQLKVMESEYSSNKPLYTKAQKQRNPRYVSKFLRNLPDKSPVVEKPTKPKEKVKGYYAPVIYPSIMSSKEIQEIFDLMHKE